MVNAQSLATPLGKIHRINEDGSIPADNPFVNLPDAVPSIWSLGHRNPEGLSFNPVTGDLWESEHGPTGGDEINVIDKGHNYGWGLASMGLEPGILRQSAPNTDPPITFYTPAIAPSGITFYSGDRYPGWKNNLFVARAGRAGIAAPGDQGPPDRGPGDRCSRNWPGARCDRWDRMGCYMSCCRIPPAAARACSSRPPPRAW